MPSLLSFGRHRLSRDDPLHILDLAGGIGSFAVGALKAGFSIASYNSVEVNPQARSVLRASVPLLCAEFPGRVTPASFSRFDERIPQDRFLACRTLPEWLPTIPAPTVISITAPCVGTSRAGAGRGILDSASSAALPAIRIAHDILMARSATLRYQPTAAQTAATHLT